ncbi:MAG: thioether cross-link-forming SCIFF peptide maturase [Clostridia bacterium]|nr:thioether cross-link-forming SCIFF peptide maturase [Clostridia bacterium]
MIHQYKLNGFNIVLDTYSGAVHCVDDLSYDMIKLYQEKKNEEIKQTMLQRYEEVSEKDIEETMREVEKLIKERKLFSKDIYENKDLDLKRRDTVVKALCLHIAHTCNLNCEYCFAGQGKYHGEDALMSFEVGKQALDFLVKNSGTRKNLEVDFFGGEPLVNFEVVKQLVKYARSIEKDVNKHFRFTLTTNGVLLDDEVIDFLNQEMNNVVLSLDGRKEIHDRLRRRLDGKGSYDIIVPKFKNFVEKRGNKEYYMRGTFTRNNLDFTKDIFHMADLGFQELSMEPVVSEPGTEYALREEDLETIYEQYEILAKEMIKRKKQGNPFTFYHYMIDLSAGPCIYKRITGCGSGTEYLAVTPSGDFYPCHQFVGDKKFLMGNVREGVTNTSLRNEFKLCNAYSRKECKDCWAKLYCSGGCSANAYHATGNIDKVYEYGCKLFKKRIECAIMVKIAEAMDEMEEKEELTV